LELDDEGVGPDKDMPLLRGCVSVMTVGDIAGEPSELEEGESIAVFVEPSVLSSVLVESVVREVVRFVGAICGEMRGVESFVVACPDGAAGGITVGVARVGRTGGVPAGATGGGGTVARDGCDDARDLEPIAIAD